MSGKFGWCLCRDHKNCIVTSPSGLACTCSCHGNTEVKVTTVRRRGRKSIS